MPIRSDGTTPEGCRAPATDEAPTRSRMLARGLEEGADALPILALHLHRPVGIPNSGAAVIHGKSPGTVGEQSAFAFVDLDAEAAAFHAESGLNCSVRPFPQANDNHGVNDLDMTTQKPGAIVKPRLLDLALKTAAGVLQAKDGVREKDNVAALCASRISDHDPRDADQLHERAVRGIERSFL